MSLAREILAEFTVAVDLKPLTELDRKIEKVKQRFKTASQVMAASLTAAGYAAYRFIEAASAVEENNNRMSRTFGSSSQEILKWSDEMSKRMQRNVYELQDATTRFGAFLKPLLKELPTDQIAQMSMTLSQLAVDLGSFYDLADEEAIMRLFSGISGETEAVRRLGIDLSDEGLSAFNKSQGDNRGMRQLTLAEKTLVRYQKILADTVDKQDDAALTAGSWANMLKGAQADLGEMSVTIGQDLMPMAKDLLSLFRDFVKGARDSYDYMVRETSTLKTMAVFLGAAGAAWFVKWLGGMNAIVGALSKVGLALRGLATWQTPAWVAGLLALEDVWTTFNSGSKYQQTGDSVLGSGLKALTGLEDPVILIKDVLDSLARIFISFGDVLLGVVRDLPGNILAVLFNSGKVNWSATDAAIKRAKANTNVFGEYFQEKKDRERQQDKGVLMGGEEGLDLYLQAKGARRSDKQALADYQKRRKQAIAENREGLQLSPMDVTSQFTDNATYRDWLEVQAMKHGIDTKKAKTQQDLEKAIAEKKLMQERAEGDVRGAANSRALRASLAEEKKRLTAQAKSGVTVSVGDVTVHVDQADNPEKVAKVIHKAMGMVGKKLAEDANSAIDSAAGAQ